MQTQVSKKDLLVQAKALGIKGRHEMPVNTLRQEVLKAQAPKTIKQKFVRKGHNPSGNKPYTGKLYIIKHPQHEDELQTASNQIRQLVKFGLEKQDEPLRGGDIVKQAVKTGYLKTKCKDPRILFGYLAKDLQKFGFEARYEH